MQRGKETLISLHGTNNYLLPNLCYSSSDSFSVLTNADQHPTTTHYVCTIIHFLAAINPDTTVEHTIINTMVFMGTLIEDLEEN